MHAPRCVLGLALAACLLLAVASGNKEADVTELKIDVVEPAADCTQKAEDGMMVSVHYKGSLTDGTVFDSSYERNEPFEFMLGDGQVIAGWEQGIVGACVGEKRKLFIPPHLGYGDQGVGPIPGGATLIFETEIVAVRSAEFEGGEGGEEQYAGYSEEALADEYLDQDQDQEEVPYQEA